jgi:hypothetical protein
MPSNWDIEECWAFKVFGPPSGALSAFWSEEWGQYRQSQNTGAFAGRRTTQQRQRDVTDGDRSGNTRVMQGSVGDLSLVGSSRPANGRPTASSQEVRVELRQQTLMHFAEVRADIAHYTALASWNYQRNHHDQRIASLAHAQQACFAANDIVNAAALRSEILALSRVEFPPAPERPVVVAPVNRAQHDEERGANFANAGADAARRVRPRTTAPIQEHANDETESIAFTQAVARLHERFRVVDMPGLGNCAFHMFKYLQDSDIPHETLNRIGATVGEDVALTRERIAAYLESHTCSEAQNPLQDAAGIDISVPMIEESGSVQNYLAWIRLDGSAGGFIELVAWARMCGVRVHLYSTTMIDNQMHEELVNWQVIPPCGGEAQTFFCLHLVDRGGTGGHYQLLQTNLVAAPAANVVQSVELNIAPSSPSQL